MGAIWFDDDFLEHDKLRLAGTIGRALQFAAIFHSSRGGTDGFIPFGFPATSAGDIPLAERANAVTALVVLGLWEPVDGGWIIHDYGEFHGGAGERAQQEALNVAWQRLTDPPETYSVKDRRIDVRVIELLVNHGFAPSEPKPENRPNSSPSKAMRNIESNTSTLTTNKRVNKQLVNVELLGNANNIQTTVVNNIAQKSKKKERENSPKSGPEFHEFWALYPRRISKQDAERAWLKLDEHDRIAAFAGIARQRDWPQMASEAKYIPYPATWLNGRRWEDEDVPRVVRPELGGRVGLTRAELLARTKTGDADDPKRSDSVIDVAHFGVGQGNH